MLFRTNSIGVRRLSFIIGLISGCFLVFTGHKPEPQGQVPVWHTVGINLINIAILFAVGFIAAWIAVRVVAWIIEGFINDRVKQ